MAAPARDNSPKQPNFEQTLIASLQANLSDREGHHKLWDAARAVGPQSAEFLNQYAVEKASSSIPNLAAIISGTEKVPAVEVPELFKRLTGALLVNEPSEYWLSRTNFGNGPRESHVLYGRPLSPAELVQNMAVRSLAYRTAEAVGVTFPSAGDVSAVAEQLLPRR